MEPNPLAKLLHAINQAIHNDKHELALRLILANFDAFKDTGPLREKVALILADKGRKKEAVELYQSVGRHYANSGNPLRAIAAARQMLNLIPDSTVLLDHIATLYNIRSPFLDANADQPTSETPENDLDFEGKDVEGEFDALLESAVTKASEKKGLVSQPGSLPAMSLLSLLPQDALRRVLELIEYDLFDQTQHILQLNKPITDLVWTVSDSLVLRDGKSILYVDSNALVGLGGFGGSARPSEIDLFATAGSEILRLNQKAIKKLSDEFEDFQNRISTLRRHAMTERVLRRHPMFENMDDDDRVQIMETFSGIRLNEGDVIIRQHTPSPGLFIILDGKVDIVRNDEDWEITIATLGSGEVFGEIGLVADSPAVAGCVMNESGHVLHLPRDDFESLAKKYPSVQDYTKMLAEERMSDVATTLSADDLSEVD